MPETPIDAFAELKAVVRRMVDDSYAAGYRRAVTLLSQTIGQPGGKKRAQLEKTLNLMEEELHKAEERAK